MTTSHEESKGMFSELPATDQSLLQQIVAHFHVRNSVKHEDGSLGEIKITPAEFRDVLAYVAEAYYG